MKALLTSSNIQAQRPLALLFRFIPALPRVTFSILILAAIFSICEVRQTLWSVKRRHAEGGMNYLYCFSILIFSRFYLFYLHVVCLVVILDCPHLISPRHLFTVMIACASPKRSRRASQDVGLTTASTDRLEASQ
jgi:hypothetical protein